MTRTTWLSLRAIVSTLVALGAVIALGGAAFVALRVGLPAATLRSHTEPVVVLFDRLSRRAAEFETATRQVRAMVRAGALDRPVVERIRTEIAGRADPTFPRSIAAAPGATRVVLARAEREFSALGNAMMEVAALMELGRLDEARARLGRVDSLERVVEHWVAEAQRRGLQDLVSRQQNVVRDARTTLQWLAAWIVASAGLLIAAAVVFRRRVRQPLQDLSDGLRAVSQGDLTVELPVRYDDEIGLLMRHFNDMTTVLRHRAQEQGRFAAAGELLAGVAHEVNNPLMAITAMAESRLAEPDLAADQRSLLQQMLRQARRAGKLLAGLLRFVRPGDREGRAVDVNEAVRGAVDLVSYQFGVDEIELDQRLNPDLPIVRLDRTPLEQILVSLLSNAIDAVRTVAPPRTIHVATWQADGMVHVSVEDNGPGVSPDLVERLFAPFSTTKKERGTGLGLYIARQIAREARGDVVYDGETGGGARFVVSLPPERRAKSRRPSPPPRRAPEGPRPQPLLGLSVLYIDDEAAVRRSVAKYLERRGAQVIQAVDGIEGLTALERYHIDVILLDLRMPRMNGVEFYTEVRNTWPQLAERVLFLSGDQEQLTAQESVALTPDRLLSKPVDLAVIEASVLARAGGRAP